MPSCQKSRAGELTLAAALLGRLELLLVAPLLLALLDLRQLQLPVRLALARLLAHLLLDVLHLGATDRPLELHHAARALLLLAVVNVLLVQAAPGLRPGELL